MSTAEEFDAALAPIRSRLVDSYQGTTNSRYLIQEATVGWAGVFEFHWGRAPMWWDDTDMKRLAQFVASCLDAAAK